MANLEALDVLTQLRATGAAATGEQQATLAAWSSWGAVPEVFDPTRPEWARLHAQVRAALSPREYDAARATTLNAHYTDPDVARVMWQALGQAGVVDGPVLEPGSGAGTFLMLAPDAARMVGVELDPTTAEISAHLNAHAQVRNEGFQDTRFEGQGASFVAAIGNVPFGAFALYDPMDNPLGLSIHNHFLAKTVKHLTPGGYALLLTSSFTMDASRSTARRHIARYADLLGAVRLPSGAMSRVAGTEVVTDVLVLRRRQPDSETRTPGWLEATTEIGSTTDGVEPSVVNDYWAAHPGHVLGQMSVGSGMHGAATLRVAGPLGAQLHTALASTLGTIIDDARPELPFASAGPTALVDTTPGLLRPNEALADLTPGHVRTTGSGFETWTGQGWTSHQVPANRRTETRALMRLRDAADVVLATQRQPATSDTEREAARAALNRTYDAYVAAYGPVSRFEWSTPRPPTSAKVTKVVETATKAWRASLPQDLPPEERAAAQPPAQLVDEWISDIEPTRPTKRYPHLDPLRDDPGFGLVLALERFDEDTGRAIKEPIFTTDVLTAPATRTRAHSPAAAMAISLDETRSIDLARIASLLGTDEDGARAAVADLTFTDHDTGALVEATTYLSGDVRAKHRQVTALVEAGRTELAGNASALASVLPAWVSLAEVTVRPGVAWIETAYLHDFAEDVFGVSMPVVLDPVSGKWACDPTPAKGLFDPVVAMRFGTSKKSVADLWLATLNNESPTVNTTVVDADGTRRSMRDVEATKAARERLATITDHFAPWLPTDPARAAALEEIYNARFNGYLAPSYVDAGNALELPGLAATIEPHPYQRSAVARILNEPTTLLDHVVGAGKTGTMIMATMELRRTGVARKPWVVVPNHLVEQTAAEWARWYPDAKVMTIPTGAGPAARRTYAAKSAAGDWDAVIVPASVFESIGVDPDRATRWSAQRVAELRAAVGTGTSQGQVKQVERQVKSIEEGFRRYLSRKDDGITFESTGCDYLFIDEAHHYKNLARASAFGELACTPGAQRASDLDFKLRALREAKTEAAERAGMDVTRYVPAVATFATGTPVANQLSEMWVMQRYLQPDRLTSLGMDTVDAWARQFTRSQTQMEIGPDGSTWRLKDRVTTIINAPELIALTGRYTDRVGRDQVIAQLPELDGGQRQIISRDASPQVADFIATLAQRANDLPRDPSIDNLLKITHEGRMIALDPRALGMSRDDDGGRVAQVADQIITIHHANGQSRYTDQTGAPAAPGALQLVFCDRSTPTGDGTFNAYDALAGELVARGMAREKIAFIHDAKDDEARARLFAAARTGGLSVLIGSTEKMGTGVNVQDRAVALHHMDCPWRPADLEQREGRILRQGNQNRQVTIHAYVTEGTYDAVMWQIVARKSAFIAQTRAPSGHRHLHDTPDEMTISAAAASAIATGDPRIVVRAELMEKVGGLETLRSAHFQQTGQARAQAAMARSSITQDTAAAEHLDALVAQRRPGQGLRVLGRSGAGSRGDHGRAVIAAVLADLERLKGGQPVPLGTVDALPVVARCQPGLRGDLRFCLELEGTAVATYPEGPPAQWSPDGITTRLHNLADNLEARAQELRSRAQVATGRLPGLEEAAAMPFEGQGALDHARHELDAINAELALGDDEGVIAAAETQETVTGSRLRDVVSALDERYRFPSRIYGDLGNHLRAGDVIRGLDGAKPVLYVVAGHEAGHDARAGGRSVRTAMIRPHDDETMEPVPLANNAEHIELISRDLAALTPAEAWAHAQERSLSPLPGTQAHRHSGPVIVQQADGSLIHGQINHVSGKSAYSPEQVQLWVNPDPLAQLDPATRREMVTVDWNQVTIWQVSASRAPRVYDPAAAGTVPGDTVSVDVADDRSPVPAGSIIAATGAFGHYTRLIGPDGTELGGGAGQLAREAGAFTHGTDLDQAAMSELGIEAARRVGELRAGDVVGAQQLDPKARLSRPVRVLSISGTGTTGMAEVAYAPVAGGEVVSIKRSNEAGVDLVSRRVGALDEGEVRRIMQPAAQWVQLSQLPDGAQFVFKDRDSYRVAHLTGAQTKTLYTAYRGAPTTTQAYTVEWDGGARRDVTDCAVLVYPDGVAIPSAVPRGDLDAIRSARIAAIPAATERARAPRLRRVEASAIGLPDDERLIVATLGD